MIEILIILAILLIAIDKLITALTIKRVEKNYPNKDKYSIEKNPLALYFFKNYGIIIGSILYFFLSIITFLFASWLFNFILPLNVCFIILDILYLMAIINNLYWFNKFKK